jgi:chromatin remodeling complex protein RSC6
MATAKKAAAKKPAAKKAPAKKAAPAKKVAAKKAPAKKRTPNAAFMKALTPSPQLAAVVGSAPLPRTEVVSKLWAYIKKNKLQDSVNKRMVNADAKLKEIFGKAQVSMFEMAGLIGKHVK